MFLLLILVVVSAMSVRVTWFEEQATLHSFSPMARPTASEFLSTTIGMGVGLCVCVCYWALSVD